MNQGTGMTGSGETGEPGVGMGPFFKRNFGAIQIIAIMIALAVIIYGINPRFVSPVNISNLLGQVVVLLIVSLGMTVVIISGEFDISVGSIVGLAGASMAWIMAVLPPMLGVDPESAGMGMLILLGLLIPLVIGTCFSMFSGLLVTAFAIPSFIVTLAMLMIGRSLTLIVTNGQPIAGVPDVVKSFGVSRPLQIPLPGSDGVLSIPSVFLVAIVVYILGWYLMARTSFGKRVYAVGANATVAKLSGINVTRVKLQAFAIVGFCSALAGVLNTARIGAASPSSGQGLEFAVIAAVVIGGTSLAGGRGGVIGTILGVVIILLIRNFLNLARIDIFWQDFATGGIILLAVLLNALQKRMAGSRA